MNIIFLLYSLNAAQFLLEKSKKRKIGLPDSAILKIRLQNHGLLLTGLKTNPLVPLDNRKLTKLERQMKSLGHIVRKEGLEN